MKNIVICCDGTWNTPDDKEQGVPVPTNVVQIYNAVAEKDSQGRRQHRYYHPGVGTDGSWWDKVIGGGTGAGLNKNIMSAYRELCEYYETDDRIFLFGFSRGAYTVRSLAGLVTYAGLLDLSGLSESEVWDRIERVFKKGYRRKSEDRVVWDKLGWKFRNNANQRIPIWFLGVWDTVGALGVPDDMGLLNLVDNLHDYTFHDTMLSPSVKTARHAVALDEMRASFQPTLWTTNNENAKQVWFPGVHSDVGGGYREAGLSHGALDWMVKEATSCELAFNPAFLVQIKPDHHDVLHDSCAGVFALLPTQPRSAPELSSGDIHSSAKARQSNPPIRQCPYRPASTTPISLDIYALPPWNATGVWLNAGTSYTFTATGEWMDSSIKCGSAGTDDGNFQFGEVAQMAGTLLGKIEEGFKKLFGNKSADFRFTRRHENMPWFSLVGAIANGGGVDARGHTEPHETFLIGSGCTYTPHKSGYFYAYANDAWNCYGNNRGRVKLSIE
ncbi:MAG: DUF2235 domain-containing protein [Candidatus Contendobacter sp.]|nr:DUF2235 domain-containing protein [Candidatus Contendobacter sp.]MDS4057498.1 DUF2235 domain-containing protein [Candidatus Contendobacter sp.]